MVELPTGTVTFLFTDLEGSTRLWEAQPEAMREAVTRHDAILHDAVERHGGVVFSTMGDGVAAAFSSAPEALAAAVNAQHALAAEQWGATGPLRARMGLHSAEGLLRAPGEYVNRPLNRCARLMSVGHGGQVLVSDATAGLTRGALPPDAQLMDLGEHRLRDLDEPIRVFQLTQPGLAFEFPPLRSVDALPGNLPRQLTTFVGRERELEFVSDLVRTRPLVTLTGVGGVGKTRLAVQVAAEVLPDFPDGAWLCELAPVSDPDAVWDTVASALGVQPMPGRSVDDSVLEHLTPRRLVLVLDNCEHLLDAVARLVDTVAQRCAGVAVLATSREGLALPGEQIVAVPSLDVPQPDADLDGLTAATAVQLFVDRAHDANRDFALTAQSGIAVGQLCRRLDGIPLAIELAAARTRSLTPEDLVSRLDQRFKLLTRGSRAALERHQTLRNTIDWSYDLLSGDEQQALQGLSVFAGGCDLAAAEAVLPGEAFDEGDVVDLLGSLVDKSLVLADDAPSGARYRMLETIRQYAQDRLEADGDAAAVRRRHADHFVAAAEGAGPHLHSRDQVTWAGAVARDVDNFRTALDWAVETGSAEHALRLVVPLAVNGTMAGYAAMDWAEAAIAIPGAEGHPAYPGAAAWAAWGAIMHGDREHGAELLARAQAAEERLGRKEPLVCQAAGTLAFFSGDLELTRAEAVEWVALGRELDDPYQLSHALILLGTSTQFVDMDAAVAYGEEAVLIARRAGIASAMSIGLAFLASLQISASSLDDPRVLRVLEEAREIAVEIGDQVALNMVMAQLAWFEFEHGNTAAALRGVRDSLEQKLAIGDFATLIMPVGLAVLGLTELGRTELGAVLLGAYRATPPASAPDWWVERMDAGAAAIESSLGAEHCSELEAQGAAMSQVECIAYARSAIDAALDER